MRALRRALLAGTMVLVAGALITTKLFSHAETEPSPAIGLEVAVQEHLQDGEEFEIPLPSLIAKGEELFTANWTVQEGGGRPLSKGTGPGSSLADPSQSLEFPRNFNRLSGPDANSCAGCHNAPFGMPGGGGDFVANVFVLGQRFDFATFNAADKAPTRGTVDEAGKVTTLGTFANNRATLGMFGSGYIEMLARQMTADLQALRDATAPGERTPLHTKGVSFGTLARDGAGNWIVDAVEGLPAPSRATDGPDDPPNLIVRPFHQAGAVVSLRQFTNNAYIQHHGIQSTERFGVDTDPDGDGFTDELTRADMTAVSVFQATLPVPGRRIPNDPAIEQAVWNGEHLFETIGCAGCHMPDLPLEGEGHLYTEPNPYNPPGNLQPGEAPTLTVDLTDSRQLPLPRLVDADDGVQDGIIHVPAYTDLKLHDITSGPDDPNAEPLDMNQPIGSDAFFAGNRKFITRKLWGAANEPPYFHHGLYTTLREAVLAHDGEARASRRAFEALPAHDRDSIIEFLKTLQVLPPDTPHRIVDEDGAPRQWPNAAVLFERPDMQLCTFSRSYDSICIR